MQQLILDLLPNQTPAFEHFLPGDNQELLAALKHWLAAPSHPYPANIFVLWGAHGSGKTFLSQCVMQAGFSPMFSCDNEPLVAHRDEIIENVQLLDDTGQQALFSRLVQAAQVPTRLFLTLDKPPEAQKTLREDVRTRLGAGHIYRLTPLDEADQRQLLAQRAQHRGWSLTPEVLDYLYQRAPRDLSSLASLIQRLDRLSLEKKRPITLPLLRTALTDALTLTDFHS